jgi:hypothetical protein
VPKRRDEEADGDVHYVAIDQGLDQSPKEHKAKFADEGKHQSINLIILKIMLLSMYVCAFTFQELK